MVGGGGARCMLVGWWEGSLKLTIAGFGTISDELGKKEGFLPAAL